MQAKIADGVYLSQGNVRKLEQFSKGASQLAPAAAGGRRQAVGRWPVAWAGGSRSRAATISSHRH